MKNVDFICGIDGGGTRTTAVCCTPDGREIARKVFGPFNLNSIGEEAFRGILKDIVSFLEETGNCRALCIGAAGVNNLRMAEIVHEAFSETGICYKLVGDEVIAHTGALNGKEGIILIAGTGSICFGKNSAGKSATAGGWGHLLGDEGSGYGLGRDAIRAVSRLLDGYGEPTTIRELIAGEFGLDTPEKIVSYVYSNDKSAVAKISHLVEKAYWDKDPVAIGIVRSNAEALVDIVMAVSSRLGLEKCDVALLGGLMEHPTCLRDEFVRLLAERSRDLHCISPLNNAAQGAVMEALEMV